jgi:hypothetical protein
MQNFSESPKATVLKKHAIRRECTMKLGLLFYFLVSWDVVRPSPLGTSATNWPIVPAPDDRWWVWSSWWNENWQGEKKYSEKTYPIATLSITNPTWTDLGLNTGSQRLTAWIMARHNDETNSVAVETLVETDAVVRQKFSSVTRKVGRIYYTGELRISFLYPNT